MVVFIFDVDANGVYFYRIALQLEYSNRYHYQIKPKQPLGTPFFVINHR